LAIQEPIELVMTLYPKIFFACHTRHVRDPKTKSVLSSHQASVLDHLDSVEPTSLHTLAAHMGVTPSTMSLTIDRLERGGYVARRRDEVDGRRVNLRLTRSGVDIKAQQTVLDPVRVRHMLEQLAPEERKESIRGLALLAAAATQSMQKTKSKTLRSAV
jgi:MarR family transcriptional regulator, organic hydroperoxide resistance regulator